MAVSLLAGIAQLLLSSVTGYRLRCVAWDDYHRYPKHPPTSQPHARTHPDISSLGSWHIIRRVPAVCFFDVWLFIWLSLPLPGLGLFTCWPLILSSIASWFRSQALNTRSSDRHSRLGYNGGRFDESVARVRSLLSSRCSFWLLQDPTNVYQLAEQRRSSVATNGWHACRSPIYPRSCSTLRRVCQKVRVLSWWLYSRTESKSSRANSIDYKQEMGSQFSFHGV